MKTVTYLLAMIGGLYTLLTITSGLMSLLGI
jgi:hypothetical protein